MFDRLKRIHVGMKCVEAIEPSWTESRICFIQMFSLISDSMNAKSVGPYRDV